MHKPKFIDLFCGCGGLSLGFKMSGFNPNRNGTIVINVRTKTKNNENGKVNSFPYVNGNFIKAGVFFKGNDNRYYIVNKRMPEIIKAIREVKLCLNLAKKQ